MGGINPVEVRWQIFIEISEAVFQKGDSGSFEKDKNQVCNPVPTTEWPAGIPESGDLIFSKTARKILSRLSEGTELL